MRRRSNRPEQLHLEFQWDYLNRLTTAGEKFDFYEETSRALLGKQPPEPEKNPVLEAITGFRY